MKNLSKEELVSRLEAIVGTIMGIKYATQETKKENATI